MMKKWLLVMMVMLILSGCSVPKTYETVSDELLPQTMDSARQIGVQLPEDGVLLDNNTEKAWLYGSYSVCLQTMPAGDLNRTLKSVTGLKTDVLSPVCVEEGDYRRYSCTWVSAGEGSEQVNRAVVLDDGSYHYVLTLHTEADRGGEVAAAWKQITGSFGLDTAP